MKALRILLSYLKLAIVPAALLYWLLGWEALAIVAGISAPLIFLGFMSECYERDHHVWGDDGLVISWIARVWQTVMGIALALALLAGVARCIGGAWNSDCRTDWDGRGNPTVCE